MPQIRVTGRTKKLLDEELKIQKEFAIKDQAPMPSMAYITETLVLQGLEIAERNRKELDETEKEND